MTLAAGNARSAVMQLSTKVVAYLPSSSRTRPSLSITRFWPFGFMKFVPLSWVSGVTVGLSSSIRERAIRIFTVSVSPVHLHVGLGDDRTGHSGAATARCRATFYSSSERVPQVSSLFPAVPPSSSQVKRAAAGQGRRTGALAHGFARPCRKRQAAL